MNALEALEKSRSDLVALADKTEPKAPQTAKALRWYAQACQVGAGEIAGFVELGGNLSEATKGRAEKIAQLAELVGSDKGADLTQVLDDAVQWIEIVSEAVANEDGIS